VRLIGADETAIAAAEAEKTRKRPSGRFFVSRSLGSEVVFKMQMQSVRGAGAVIPPVFSEDPIANVRHVRGDSSRPARFAYAKRVLNSQARVRRVRLIRDETRLIGPHRASSG